MKIGNLSQYFSGVAAKRLTAVEADPDRSNQHEFQGINALRTLLGTERITQMPTTFMYLCDEEERIVRSDGFLTWYDCREKNNDRTAEYHLYYRTTEVSQIMQEGDLLLVTKKSDGGILVILVQGESTVENQVMWLFGVEKVKNRLLVRQYHEHNKDIHLNFASKAILEELDVAIEETHEDLLEGLIAKFGEKFPTTAVFSGYARDTSGISSVDDPDSALTAWMEREDLLFRTMERYLVSERLQEGFAGDIDSFVSFSLTVHNRRKSRVGHALEHHLEHAFREHSIRYSRCRVTENRSKPDFIFPGIKQYHDETFPTAYLTMLGVKTTCKDRWRQILAEAERISQKHLFTLELGISESQTKEMESKRVVLVLPKQLHSTYKVTQQQKLLDLKNFIHHIKELQSTGV